VWSWQGSGMVEMRFVAIFSLKNIPWKIVPWKIIP
jgi:hypothetical protein